MSMPLTAAMKTCSWTCCTAAMLGAHSFPIAHSICLNWQRSGDAMLSTESVVLLGWVSFPITHPNHLAFVHSTLECCSFLMWAITVGQPLFCTSLGLCRPPKKEHPTRCEKGCYVSDIFLPDCKHTFVACQIGQKTLHVGCWALKNSGMSPYGAAADARLASIWPHETDVVQLLC